MADVTFNAEVWNQPIAGYTFYYSNYRYLTYDYIHAAPGTSYLIDVDLELRYIVETAPSRYQVLPYIKTKRMKYTLELNAAGYIIGGEWLSDARPDFLWSLRRKPSLKDDGGLDYEKIKYLIDLSLGDATLDNPETPETPEPPESPETPEEPLQPEEPENPDLQIYKLKISPQILTLKTGESYQFTGHAINRNLDPLDIKVEWYVLDEEGSVDQTGLYTAPNTPGTYRVQIEYYSDTLNKYFEATATIFVQAGSEVVTPSEPVEPVEVEPTDPINPWEEQVIGYIEFEEMDDYQVLVPGQQLIVKAVYYDEDWNRQPVQFHYKADGGHINHRGIYTAPTTPGTYTITVNPIMGGEILSHINNFIYVIVEERHAEEEDEVVPLPNPSPRPRF